MAGETNLDLTVEDGTFNAFNGIEAGNVAVQATIVTTPLRGGFTKVMKILERPGDVWTGNNTVRCLLARYNTGETTGQDYWFARSMYLPSGSGALTNNNLIWELHHPSSLYNLAGLAVAPHNLNVGFNGGNGYFMVGMQTGLGTVGAGYQHYFPPHDANGFYSAQILAPVVYDTWVDFLTHIKFSEGTDGVREEWIDVTGTATFTTTPQWSKYNLATMPYCNNPSVHNVQLYTEMGLYTGVGSIPDTDTIYHTGHKRRLSKAVALSVWQGTGGQPPPPPPPPPPPVTVASSITSGQTLSGQVIWLLGPLPADATSGEFYANSVLQNTATGSGAGGHAFYQYTLDTTLLTNGANTVGYRVYNASGLEYASPSISVVVDNTTPPVVSQTGNWQTITFVQATQQQEPVATPPSDQVANWMTIPYVDGTPNDPPGTPPRYPSFFFDSKDEHWPQAPYVRKATGKRKRRP